MKITQRQLQKIIKEEIVREMQHMPIGKGMFGKGPAMARPRMMMQRRAAAEEHPGPPDLRYADIQALMLPV